MKKILLTGSTGFLGSIIKNELSVNHQILELLDHTGLRLDLRDLDFLPYNVVDGVIHAAGKAHLVPRTLEESKQFYEVNVEGTKKLLAAIDKFEIKPEFFVFISSVSVYGLDEGRGIKEDHPLNASDPYGLSKIEAEKIVQEWSAINHITCTIIRLPLIVGKHAPGNLGQMIHSIKKGYYFEIGKGRAKKSMVLAKDVAWFINHIMQKGGIYNLTDGYHPSFYELSSSISHSLSFKKPKSIPYFVAQLAALCGDIIGKRFPINSAKLKKITNDLTFDDSKAKSSGWKSRSVLSELERIV